jgi:presequence protease
VGCSWKKAWTPGDEGLTIPAQVNYVGKGANLYQLGYSLDGSLLVIGNALRTTWLWERVRMRGGAYGAYFAFDHRSGILTFLSYRDPNLLETLKVYDDSGEFLRKLELNQDELTKNIIGVISDLDAYQLPDAKGYTSMIRYLSGETEESRQRLRDQVLSTTVDDFHAFAETLDKVKEVGQIVVLGSAEVVAKAGEGLAAHASNRGGFNLIKVM